ncbi:hypothetical protein P0Y35_04945 [Kiritimatiellaeota bacterium B1221]|nr:hypothetical protein [Kiritimatiellaeota bacterium B1221]
MKPTLKIIFLSLSISVLGLANVFGFPISVTFNPTLNGGVDTEGVVGSTWTFTYEITDTVYSDFYSGAAVLSDSATLTVSGVTNPNYNGVFSIVESTATDFVFWPNFGGNAYISYNPVSGSESFFTFGDAPNTVSVQALALQGSSSATVSIGGPVEPSHFDGLVVSDAGISVGSTVYAFNNGVITVIPEPSILLLSVFSVGMVLVLRRHLKLAR